MHKARGDNRNTAMNIEELTKEERNVIASLKRLAARWPNTLWLFSSSGSLYIMKKTEEGKRAETKFGGIDPDYVIASIDGIPNDGGDW